MSPKVSDAYKEERKAAITEAGRLGGCCSLELEVMCRVCRHEPKYEAGNFI